MAWSVLCVCMGVMLLEVGRGVGSHSFTYSYTCTHWGGGGLPALRGSLWHNGFGLCAEEVVRLHADLAPFHPDHVGHCFNNSLLLKRLSPHGGNDVCLQAEGFSEEIIDRFFRPFLGGIFFNTSLTTSSRLFEFVMRMLASGDNCLPTEGIGALAAQLEGRLPAGSVILGARACLPACTTLRFLPPVR